jgi:ADP-ribosylglycohydrolase
MQNKTYQALWGQCIGDAVGRHLLNKQNPQELWGRYYQTQNLPFKRANYSIYAKHSILFAQQFLNKNHQNITDYIDRLLPRLRSNTSNSLLCRAIRNGVPFNSPDIETAVRLGPLATCFEEHEKMLDWHYHLTKLLSLHPISISGALLYSSACWHAARNIDVNIFEKVIEWNGSTNINSNIWWSYQQSFWILENRYGVQEMLTFIDSFLQQEDQILPAARQIISTIPLLWFHRTNDFGTSYSHALTFGAELDLIGGMSGCLTALCNGIPVWLQTPFMTNRTLQKYPIDLSQDKDNQFKLF